MTLRILRSVRVTTFTSLSFLLLSALSSVASAQPPYAPDLVKEGNRWTITAYNDASPVHDQWATQGICFVYDGTVGTHQRYTWYSDTFPNWNGRATQEGDLITMHGDYAKDVGHDGIQWNIVTVSPRNEGAGHWWEWREDTKLGRTIGFANTKLQRVGKCSITFEESVNLPPLIGPDGQIVENPIDKFKLDVIPL